MARKRSASKGEKINPHFWVFCEGKTEEAYISCLRSKYRIPIEIVSKIVGSKITDRFIKEYKKGKPIHAKDKDFLIYDADVPEILDRLRGIKTAMLIASNPSMELWFLLHYKNQITSISSQDCIRELSKRNRNSYQKGVIDKNLEVKLTENLTKACERASHLILFNNPSSNMNVFISELENARRNKI